MENSLGLPRLRGKDLFDFIIAQLVPESPLAYAGKTPRQYHESNIPWDHPRLRGKYFLVKCSFHRPEYLIKNLKVIHSCLSSPLPAVSFPRQSFWLSILSILYSWAIRHNYIRNLSPENIYLLLLLSLSYPLRSAAYLSTHFSYKDFNAGMSSEITPAYAGKTKALPVAIPMTRDHPRLRGKDKYSPCGRLSVVGSPPLTRERP